MLKRHSHYSYPIRKIRGSSLLLVLAVMAVIGTAMAGLLVTINAYLDKVQERRAGFKAYQLAHSGVAIALQSGIQPDHPLLKQELNELESFKVELTSENARLNINALVLGSDPSPLQRLFELWGLNKEEADILVDRLGDWTDGDSLKKLNGAEELDYLAAGRRGQPRNAAFKSLDEMENVLGMGRVTEVRPDWKQYFTVWANTKLNLMEADEIVIRAYFDITEGQVESFTSYRYGRDGIRYTDDDPEDITLDEALSLLGVPLDSSAEVLTRIGIDSTHHRIVATGIVGTREHTLEVIAPSSGNVAKNSLVWLRL
ncbi:MAG: hypothetical protein AAF571_06305 [Verrucomicrobiota bacterium]